MNTVKGLFFDMDGTLVDTLDANIEAYTKAVKEIDRSLTRKMYVSTYGMRVDAFLKLYFPDISDAEIEIVKQTKAKLYPSYLHLAKPNHQLINFVRTLRDSHTTALVTMAQINNAKSVIEATNIGDLFDFIISGDSVKNAKPHPESYLLALEKAKLKANEVVAFEDSKSGIDAAKAAGISVITIAMPGMKS